MGDPTAVAGPEAVDRDRSMPAPRSPLVELARTVAREHLLCRLHTVLPARGWVWDLEPGRCPPPGFTGAGEWVEYVPGETLWSHPGTLHDPDGMAGIVDAAGPAGIYWLDTDVEIGVWNASADCCADHDRNSMLDRSYRLTAAGLRELLAALPAVEGRVLSIPDVARCPGRLPART